MIIEYDEEDRCIRVNGEVVTPVEAWGMIAELEEAISQHDADHATCDNPDGHYDE
jgi:hypothetical protein